MNVLVTPALRKGQTHIWVLDTREFVGIPAWRDYFSATLNHAEVARILSFRFIKERDQFLYSHGFLRCLLACYAKRNPKELIFGASEFGKPLLANSPLHFNLSHSGSLIAAAVTESGPCGVDIEEKRALKDCHLLVERFSSEEKNFVHEHRSKTAAIWQIWTLKESYLKAHGLGLRLEPATFSVVDSAGVIRPGKAEDAQTARMFFREFGAYSLAACVLNSPEGSFAVYDARVGNELISSEPRG